MPRNSVEEHWLAQIRSTTRILVNIQQYRQSRYNAWALDLDLFKYLDRLAINPTDQNYFFGVKRCLLFSAFTGLKNYRLSQRKIFIRKFLFIQDVPGQGVPIMGIRVSRHWFSSHKTREGNIQNRITRLGLGNKFFRKFLQYVTLNSQNPV